MQGITMRLVQRVLLPFALVCAARANAGWQHDWNETGPAFEFGPTDRLQVASTPTGWALIGFFNGFDYRLSQVRGDADIAWHVAVTPSEWTPDRVVAEPDGAALVLFNGPTYASVARFDASGALQWSSALQTTYVAVGADQLSAMLVGGGNAIVTAIDRYTGQWRWQIRVPGFSGNSFTESPLAVDADGNTYVGGAGAGSGHALAKLDRKGTLLWLRQVAATDTVTVRDGRIYVTDAGTLQALDPASGQPLWRKDGCGAGEGELSFVDADPLCASASELSRLSAATGTEIWRRDIAGSVLGVFGGDVYIGSDPVSFPPAPAVLQRLAGGDGATQWQQSPPFALRGRIWQVSDSLIGIVGLGPTRPGVALYRYRMQDGSLYDSPTLADVPRGVSGAGELRDGADLFVVGQMPWKTLPTHVRRLAADSGSVLWENAATQRRDYPGIALTPNRLLLAERADGDARVRSIDRTSGQLRWERSIAEGARFSASNNPPRVVGLDDDDALVSFGYNNYTAPSPSRRVQELQRLDDAAGNTLWNKQITEWHTSSISAPWNEPALLRLGEDALIWPGGGFAGPFGMDAERRSGTDGTLEFSVTAAPVSQTVRLSVAADAVFALTQPGQGMLRLVKHSATTGALLWQFDYPTAPWRELLIEDMLPLADGDVMVLVLLYQPSAAGGQSSHLLRVKGDGSGLRYAYRTVMQGKTRNLINHIAIADDGQALLQRLLYQDRRGIEFLQRFDLEQARVTGSQALTLRGIDPFVPRAAWGTNFKAHGDGVLISGTALRSPLPTTRRDALLDTTVVQRGDLALQMPVFPRDISVGDTVPFTVGVSYSGDAAITDATLIVELPWQGSESGLSCGGPGIGRCDVRVRHGQIAAHFDATPGAQLELRGSVQMLAAPALARSALRALVYAPIGLLESDVYNNFRTVAVEEPIFADGFNGW